MLFAVRIFRQDPGNPDLWHGGPVFYTVKDDQEHLSGDEERKGTVIESLREGIETNLLSYLKENIRVKVWVPTVVKEVSVSIDGEEVSI